MSESAIKFGTDGWRGIIAEDFTFDNVRICAQGVADNVNQGKPTKRSLPLLATLAFFGQCFKHEPCGVAEPWQT